MRGNALQGGYAYTPAEYVDRVNPADVAEWANMDSFTTHTATEVSGLWDAEVPPGEVRRRVLEAGTHRYACRFHPQMTGTFAVTPFAYAEIRPEQVVRKVRVKRRKPGKPRYRKVRRTVFRRAVRVQWAPGATEHAFDVQRRLRGGVWADWLVATSAAEGSFRATAGQEWEVRARLRDPGDAARATGWSPPASVLVD
jgi:hypothetical protein